MDKNEFVRKFERILKKYGKQQKFVVVRVTFDGGYTDCTGYRIWGRNVRLTSTWNLASQHNPKGVKLETVIKLKKVKSVRKGAVL